MEVDMESGNIIIVETNDPFQKVSKESIYDMDIDVTTLGVYVRILALGKKWKLNIQGLYTLFNKNEKTISKCKIRECIIKLEQKGFIRREQCYDEHHRCSGWNYFVYETRVPEEERTRAGLNNPNPSKKTDSEVFNNTENGLIEIPTSRNSELRKFDNTESLKSIYKEYKEIKNINKDEERKVNKELSLSNSLSHTDKSVPSLEDVFEYYDSRHYQYASADKFYHHYKRAGWMINGEPINNWRAILDKWEEQDRTKAEEAGNATPYYQQRQYEEPDPNKPDRFKATEEKYAKQTEYWKEMRRKYGWA